MNEGVAVLRRLKKKKVVARYFTWLLGCRHSVWQADGRSNSPGLGRHSLGTTDYEEAKRLLCQLDLTMAVKHGLADAAALTSTSSHELSLDEGRRLYLEFVGRARVAGGVRPSSRKRYRAVLDKFLEYVRGKGLTAWNSVKSQTLLGYAEHLDLQGYAPRTEYMELTTLKQAILWFVKRKYLPADCRIELPLEKPEGTDTYSWKVEEVRAMLKHCRAIPQLQWLSDVIIALAMTGLRISELRFLRRSDIDFQGGMIRLVDETSSSQRRKKGGSARRTLKSGSGRTFPIQEDLLQVLLHIPAHPDGYMFHGPRGGQLKPDVVRRVLIRDVLGPLAKQFPSPLNEVGFGDGRLHSFRHFFCSLCANRSVPQRVVMRWLGHKESRMVEHYYHLHDEEARRQMSRIKLFEENSGGHEAAGE
jgi:integrase